MDKNTEVIVEALIEYIRDNRELRDEMKQLRKNRDFHQQIGQANAKRIIELEAELATVNDTLTYANTANAELANERDKLLVMHGNALKECDNTTKACDILADRVNGHEAHLQEVMQERDNLMRARDTLVEQLTEARRECDNLKKFVERYVPQPAILTNNPISEDYP